MALEGLVISMEKRAERLAEEIAEEILDEIHSILKPGYGYDTGMMSRGYRAIETPYGYAIVQTARPRVEPPVWQFVEFGTRQMHARPHIRPAIEAVKVRRR